MTRPLEGIEVVELSPADDAGTTIIRNRPILSPGPALVLASLVVLVVLAAIFTGGDTASPSAAPIVRPTTIESALDSQDQRPGVLESGTAADPSDDHTERATVLGNSVEPAPPAASPSGTEPASSDVAGADVGLFGIVPAGDAAATGPVTVLALAEAPDGDRTIVESRPERPPTVTPIEGSHGAEELDATGRWMAGLSLSPGGALTLWAGPVGQPLVPVASRVQGFSWHDTDTGILAWTERDPNGRPAILVLDLDGGDAPTTVPVEVDGPMAGYGDWGFAISARGDRDRVHLIGPKGKNRFTYPGTLAGGISRHQVLLSRTARIAGGGLVVIPDDGIGRPADGFDEGEYPDRARRSPDGWHAAVHVLVGGPHAWGDDNHVDVFTPVATSMRIPHMAQATPLAWSDDGRHLAIVRHRAAGRPTILVVDVIASTVTEHPPLPDGSATIRSLAVLPATRT